MQLKFKSNGLVYASFVLLDAAEAWNLGVVSFGFLKTKETY